MGDLEEDKETVSFTNLSKRQLDKLSQSREILRKRQVAMHSNVCVVRTSVGRAAT